MIKPPITPRELFQKFEVNLMTAQALGNVNCDKSKLSLPYDFFQVIEAYLNDVPPQSQERIGEGYVFSMMDHQFVLVMSKLTMNNNLDDMLVMMPLTDVSKLRTDDSFELGTNSYGEQYLIAYLPKKGCIAVIAGKSGNPKIAAAYFYPSHIEVQGAYSYSDLRDVKSYLQKRLGEDLWDVKALNKGIELLRSIQEI
jgi:hypothetical protein